jgi:Flp pilus assembly protein TadD/TolB-like protein
VKTSILALVLISSAACSRTREPVRGPLVVLRFENLTGDSSFDWMERGAPRQIAFQLEGVSVADSTQPAGERERAIAGGTRRILRGYVSRYGDRLRLRADLEDAAPGHFALSAESMGAISAGLLPLAAAVARQLDPGARLPGAKNETALEAYIAALDSPDPTASAESLARALSADPDFGAAYLMLVELSLSRQDRVGAERALATARARGDAIPAIDRARLDVAAAQLSGNAAALSESLAALSRLAPADLSLLRNLAATELAARRYPAAIEYFRKALAVQPGDTALLNMLGYAQAYAGDLDGAVRSLREYERVRPGDANPLDSLAEVHFYRGRFAESEKFYRQAYEKDAAFFNGVPLMKAALARFMSGDPAGAEAIFAEYEAARRAANDPLIDSARARWDYLRGKRGEAVRKLESFAATTKVQGASELADCTLTLWQLEAGDRAAAAKRSACPFLTDPRAASFPTPMARVYALLLAKDFSAALPLLREITARAAPNPTDPAPALLAWALEETGHFEEAETYLRITPTPAAPAPDLFESLVYPRIFYLRAVAADKRGATAEAERNYRLFRALSGNAG